MNEEKEERDARLYAIPDLHGHAKGEHKPYAEERPLPLTARMLFLWFYHACRRGYPRFLMVADHMNYLTFEDPAAVNLVRRALKLAQAGDLYGAAETANVDVAHAAVVSEGLRRGMRYSIGAEVDNDPRSRPDAQNIVDAMRPDAIIRSVHFINVTHPVHGENWPWPFDNPEFKDMFEVVGTEQTWELYVNALVDAIERLPGHIVGHFFVPAVFGHWPDDAKLSEYEDRVLAAAEARGMAVEFNTRFFYRDHSDDEKDRYLAANARFLRKAKDRGVLIAIGSDAHSPKDQGGAFDVVLHVLDQLDINEIVFPLGGQLRRVALRVVREPDPEPQPEPVPAPEPPPEPQPAAADHAAAEPAKPVRKARAAAKATRPPQTSPERPPERPETSAAAPEPPPDGTPPAPADDEPSAASEPVAAEPAAGEPAAPEPTPAEPAASESAASEPVQSADAGSSAAQDGVAPRPARVRKSRAKPKPEAPAAASEPAPERAPEPGADVVATAAKAALDLVTAVIAPAKSAPAPAKRSAPEPPAAKPAAAKPVAAKPAAAKPAAAKAAPGKAPPSRTAASKNAPARPAAKASAGAKSAPPKKATPAKAGAKKVSSAKAAAKKAAPARAAAKKPAPVKRTSPAKKGPPKKAAPGRTAAKKAAPKKPAAKKAAPARHAPARKAAAKKTTAKKTATKRR